MKTRQIWVDKARPEDAAEAEVFFQGTKDNLVDPDVFTYPATRVLKAHKSGEAKVYLPTNLTFMLESLGINPHNTELDTALALKQLMQVVRYQAKELGMGEIYMPCREPRTVAFAEHNGFEKFDIPIYRLKI